MAPFARAHTLVVAIALLATLSLSAPPPLTPARALSLAPTAAHAFAAGVRMPGAQGFVASFWAKRSQTSGGGETPTALAVRIPGSTTGLALGCSGAAPENAFLVVDGVVTSATLASGIGLCTGGWVHVVVVFAPGSSVDVRIDGTTVAHYDGGVQPYALGGGPGIDACLVLGQDASGSSCPGSFAPGSSWGGEVAEVVLRYGVAGDEVGMAERAASVLTTEAVDDSGGRRTWAYWSFEKSVKASPSPHPSSPYSGPWIYNAAPALSLSRRMVLADGAAISSAGGLLLALDRSHEHSLYLEPGLMGSAASATVDVHLGTRVVDMHLYLKCWPDNVYQTLLSAYCPESGHEVVRLIADTANRAGLVVNGTTLPGLAPHAICTGAWQQVFLRVDPGRTGVWLTIAGSAVYQATPVPDVYFPQDGSASLVVSLGHAVTGVLPSRSPVLGAPALAANALAVFDLRINPYWYETDFDPYNAFCLYKYDGANVWLFANDAALAVATAASSPSFSLGPLAVGYRDRPRAWTCPHKVSELVYKGKVYELFEVPPAEHAALYSMWFAGGFAEGMRGVDREQGRLAEIESAADASVLVPWMNGALTSPATTDVLLGAVRTGSVWEWRPWVYSVPFVSSGVTHSSLYAPGAPYPGTYVHLKIDVTAPSLPWVEFEPTYAWMWDLDTTFAFVTVLGNCSSSGVVSAGHGGECPSGFVCCAGSCIEGQCTTLLSSFDYGSHAYEVYSIAFVPRVWAIVDLVASMPPHPTNGSGYIVQVTSAGENAAVAAAADAVGVTRFFIDGNNAGELDVYTYAWGPLAGSLMQDRRNSAAHVTPFYQNFDFGAPDHWYGGLEQHLELRTLSGVWNDVPSVATSIEGIVVEYGGCEPANPCPPGEACVGGVCVCPTGTFGPTCGESCACVAANTVDPGGAGAACERVGGGCVAACASPWIGAVCAELPPPPPPPPPANPCGNGVVDRPAESCDDGNTVGGDGCSSSCAVEAGWACVVAGAACVDSGECAAGTERDCAGECGGSAFVDVCGDCVGGATGRGAGASRDACDVCCGPGLDACGGCGETMDVCGVCLGDNTTCVGCDGVPNSGATYDVCGVCGGDGSSCLGCDGVPVPQGGKVRDKCGVCGGPATATCVHGCAGPGTVYDCAGVCNGSAVVDVCGVCVGGNTTRVAEMHKDACGVCFGSCVCGPGMAQTTDACGVCGGSGTTCTGCDGGIGAAGAVVDVCGVCGGDGSSCVASCSPLPGATEVYDCAGVCGGSAEVDVCGVCWGGTTGVSVAGFHVDSCGMCFGANRGRDVCGVCVAAESEKGRDRDACGVCFGNNAALDSCGVCFGTGRAEDACGVCFGNASSCVFGCDGVADSGRTVDSCGVCGGSGGCGAGAASKTTVAGMPFAAAVGSFSVLVVCCVAGMLGLVVLRTRRGQAKVHTAMEEEALAGVPAGPGVAFVVTDIVGSTRLWEEAPPGVMDDVMEVHNGVMRRAIGAGDGWEIRTEGDAFLIAFHNPSAAVAFCLAAQQELYAAEWPEWVLHSTPLAASVDGVWRGPRVRMGVHVGDAVPEFDERAKRATYRGTTLKDAERVSDLAAGGGVLVSGAVADAVESSAEWEVVAWAGDGGGVEHLAPLRVVVVPGFEARMADAAGSERSGAGDEVAPAPGPVRRTGSRAERSASVGLERRQSGRGRRQRTAATATATGSEQTVARVSSGRAAVSRARLAQSATDVRQVRE